MLTTECGSTVYHGIKKLWQSEAKFWKKVINPEYYLYRVSNSNRAVDEYWLVEQPSDLKTLERYLRDSKRPKEALENITKIAK